jgi:hypothetical protein
MHIIKVNKKSRFFQISAVILVLCVLTFFAVSNNTNLFSSGKKDGSSQKKIKNAGAETEVITSRHKPSGAVEASQNITQNESEAVSSAKIKSSVKSAVKDTTRQYQVEIKDIQCKLADREEITVVLSVLFICRDKAAKQEALFKREDLKVLIRKVMSSIKLTEIQVDDLRAAITNIAGEVLGNGAVTDVEFIRFQML